MAVRDDVQRQVVGLRLVGELVAQSVQQFDDGEAHDVETHGPSLDLVHVQQRVEHPAHRRQRLRERDDEPVRSSAVDCLGEQSLDQREGLQRLS